MTLFLAADFETPHKALAVFRDHVGYAFVLRPFERIISVRTEDGSAAVLLDKFEVKERARGWSISKHGKRLVAYARDENGYYKRTGQLDLWDEEFTPFDVLEYGSHRSVQEYIDRIWYERECYRPGTKTQPMDNYERACEGYSSDSSIQLDTRKVAL